jgi:hypothetical protein
LIATTDTTADVTNAGAFALLLSALGVLEVFVSAVEDDVAFRQVGFQTFENLVADAAMWEGEDK